MYLVQVLASTYSRYTCTHVYVLCCLLCINTTHDQGQDQIKTEMRMKLESSTKYKYKYKYLVPSRNHDIPDY